MCFAFFEKSSRTKTLWLKKFRRTFKSKEPGNPFLKTVKIFSAPLNTHVECKMILDTGCDPNLISIQTLRDISMLNSMDRRQENICICLNGGSLSSVGTITLRWKGKRFRKIFTTTFHVIDCDRLQFQVVLGAETIIEHGIVKFAGFGGKRIVALPKKTKDERNDLKNRHDKHREDAAANDADVDADIRAREEAARRDRDGNGGSSSGNSSSSRRGSNRNNSC